MSVSFMEKQRLPLIKAIPFKDWNYVQPCLPLNSKTPFCSICLHLLILLLCTQIAESCSDISTMKTDVFMYMIYIPAGEIGHCAWLEGPSILKKGRSEELREAPYELVDPNKDREVRPLLISSKKTSDEQLESFGVHRFERFSTW